MATRTRSRSPGGKAAKSSKPRPPRNTSRRAPARSEEERAADVQSDALEREGTRLLEEHAAANPEPESDEARIDRLAEDFAAPTPAPKPERKSRARKSTPAATAPAGEITDADPIGTAEPSPRHPPALPGFEKAAADVDRIKGRATAEAAAQKAVKAKLAELGASLKAAAVASDDEFLIRSAAHGADLCLSLRREIAELVEIVIEGNSRLAKRLGVDPEQWR